MAQLKNISIQGFKSIDSIKDLEIRPINMLIGANGAGKTNFLNALNMLSAIANGSLKSHVTSRGGADKFFHYGVKNTDSISFTLKIGRNSYDNTLMSDDSDNMYFHSEKCGYLNDQGYTSWYNLHAENGESGILKGNQCQSQKVQEYTREYIKKIKTFHFHDTSKDAQFKKQQKLRGDAYLLSSGENIADVLYRYKSEERYAQYYKKIVQSIQAVAPYFDDFVLERIDGESDDFIRLQWRSIYSEQIFDASDLSDGTARFILMATLFLSPVVCLPTVIILDEPELGLHPKALAVLAEIIKATSQRTQIICSTQSVELANHFEPNDFIVVDQKDGKSTFNRPDAEQLDAWLEDYGMGDIWCKNLIGGRP